MKWHFVFHMMMKSILPISSTFKQEICVWWKSDMKSKFWKHNCETNKRMIDLKPFKSFRAVEKLMISVSKILELLLPG
jgi:hypothetical protein